MFLKHLFRNRLSQYIVQALCIKTDNLLSHSDHSHYFFLKSWLELRRRNILIEEIAYLLEYNSALSLIVVL